MRGTTRPPRATTSRHAPSRSAGRWRAFGRGQARIASDERGIAATEFAIVLPLLLGLFLSGVTLFDVYRFAERAETTTYTIADILSRRENTDKDDLRDIHAMHIALLEGTARDVRTRVSSVVFRQVRRRGPFRQRFKLVPEWTYDSANPDNRCRPADDLPLDLVPAVALNESVIIVETEAGKSLFSTRLTGNQRMDFDDVAIVRPRYSNTLGLANC